MDRVASRSYLFDRNNGREPENWRACNADGGYGRGIKIKKSRLCGASNGATRAAKSVSAWLRMKTMSDTTPGAQRTIERRLICSRDNFVTRLYRAYTICWQTYFVDLPVSLVSLGYGK